MSLEQVALPWFEARPRLGATGRGKTSSEEAVWR